MFKYGWPVLVPAFIAAAIVGAEKFGFEVPLAKGIADRLSGKVVDTQSEPKTVKPVERSASNNYGLEEYAPKK